MANIQRLCLLIIGIQISQYAFAQLKIKGISNVFEDGTLIRIEREYPFHSVFSYPNVIHETVIKGQRFTFNIKSNSAELYRLYVKVKTGKEMNIPLFLDTGDYSLVLEDTLLKQIVIKDSQVFTDYCNFNKIINDSKESKEFGSFRFPKSPSHIEDSIARIKFDSLYNRRNQAWAKESLNWLKNNTGSKINSYVIYKYIWGKYTDSLLSSLFKNSNTHLFNDSWARELTYNLSNLSVGCQAPNFMQQDNHGKEISLSDFRGNIVVLDFWASWCGPCRKENPNLKQLSKKYDTYPFVIISVSLDDQLTEWNKAMNIDTMDWINVSDLKGRNNVVAKLYNINQIPMNYVVNENGKIIAKDLHGDELKKTIEKIFDH